MVVILHKDEFHFPLAKEVYGNGVWIAVLDDDAMDQEEPIVAPAACSMSQGARMWPL